MANIFEAAAPVQQYFVRVDVQFHPQQAKAVSPFYQILSFPFSRISKLTLKPFVNGLITCPSNLPVHSYRPCSMHLLCHYQQEGKCLNFFAKLMILPLPGSTNNKQLYTQLCDSLDTNLLVSMIRQGLLTHYNCLDIVQTHTLFITIHYGCSDIRKLLSNHGWDDMKPYICIFLLIMNISTPLALLLPMRLHALP
jgi:hypothetical protein